MGFFDLLKDLFFSQAVEKSNTSFQDEMEEAAREVNGSADAGEETDILSEIDDEENFNIQGDGYRDNSSGYGRENESVGYPNPFDRNSS